MTAATKFIVLARTGTEEPGTPKCWEEVVVVEATNRDQAIRQVGGREGEFVAVPLRSFQPVRVEVERVERVRVYAATTAAATTEPKTEVPA